MSEDSLEFPQLSDSQVDKVNEIQKPYANGAGRVKSLSSNSVGRRISFREPIKRVHHLRRNSHHALWASDEFRSHHQSKPNRCCVMS